MTSLGRRSVHAALWGNLGNVARVGLQFLAGVLLARLLGPEAFGLVAVALIIIGLGQLVADFGLSSAIIQAPALDDRDVNCLYGLQLLAGLGLTGALIGLAGPLAALFSAPDALPVICWMAPLFLLQGIGQTPHALLYRDLDFKSVQIGRLAGYAIGYLLIGLPMALACYGVWSLVCAHLAQAGLSSMIALAQVKRRLRPRLEWRGSALYRFGGVSLIANLGSWTMENAGAAMVGFVSGTTNLGLYNRALGLSTTPVSALATGLQTVLLAAASRAQDDLARVRKAVLACVAFVILLCGSVLLAIVVTARSVVAGIYGPAWSAAADLLPPLGLAMVLHGLLSVIGPALAAIGKVGLESRMQWIATVAMLPLLGLASQFTVAAIAWAVFAAYALRLGLVAIALHRSIAFNLVEVVAALSGPVMVAMASALFAALFDQLFVATGPLVHLAAIVLAAGLGLGCAVLALRTLLVAGPLGDAWSHSGIAPGILLKLRAGRTG